MSVAASPGRRLEAPVVFYSRKFMLFDIATLLIDTAFTLFGVAVLLRVWMQWTRVTPHHGMSRAVFTLTHWLVAPLRRVIPGYGGTDWASIVAAYATALTYLLIRWSLLGASGDIPVAALLIMSVLAVCKWTINLVMWMTILQALLSWLNPQSPVMGMLHPLTAPILRPFQRVLPRLGGVDLSPLAVFLLAQIALIVVASLGQQLLPA
jgi:YggT family protein